MNQLDKNIAVNLKRIRKAKNLSLDMLAERTGVSKSMLGQIERGESNPTVATIAKIVEGIKVPFEEFLYIKQDSVTIVDCNTLPIYKEKENEYKIKIIFPYDKLRKFEVFEGNFEPGAVMTSAAHGENSSEYVTVVNGELTLQVGENKYIITTGHAIRFDSDQEHSYMNNGEELLIMNMVLSYENASAS